MRTTLLTLTLLILLPLSAMAQTEWSFTGPLWNDVLDEALVGSGHGVAVDPDGKIWFQPFSATDSVQVPDLDNTWQDVRVIYIFNPDGTMNDMSPLKFIDFGGGVVDTLGGLIELDSNLEKVWEGKSGRGLRADYDGNILIAAFNFIYKVDYQTGMGLAVNRFDDLCAAAAPAVDQTGRVFVAPVCPGPPIRVLDSDLQLIENARDLTVGFSRSLEVSPDGNTVFWAGYTNHAIAVYQRPDEFSPYDSLGVVLEGFDSESLTINRVTNELWASSGSQNDAPNRFDGVTTSYLSNTWYSFSLDDLLDLDGSYTPLNFLSWGECETYDSGGVCLESAGRPRGLAFSPDGMIAYATQFSQEAPSLHEFSAAPTSIEQTSEIPGAFTLEQNYPNPFNPSTTIAFQLDQSGHATLRVFDMLGRQVGELVNTALPAGSYEYTFDASGLT